MSDLVIRAHAKINLSLRITGRRADGYHDLRTVFQALALHDTLACTRRDGPFCLQSNAPGLPLDGSNLVWRAAAALWDASGRPGEPRDAVIAIDKRIPLQGGLGGGSADAAAALRLLSRAWRLSLPPASLHAVAVALGADVPFFLVGGAALGLGRGDLLYPLADLPRLAIVLVVPAFGVSTADAYRWWDESAPGPSDPTDADGPRRVPGDWPAGASEVANDFEALVCRRHPEIGEAVQLLLERGAAAAALSGSGSAVFGLFDRAGVARRAAAAAAACGWRTLVTRTLGRAEYARLARPRARRPAP